MIRWQHAQVVTLELEGAVETGAEILQGDCRGQFDDLSGSETALQFFKHRVRHFRRRPGHALGIMQHRFLAPIEMRAGFEYRNILQLCVADAGISAHGRVDIHSEGATDHLRSPQRGHDLEMRLDCIRALYCPSQAEGGQENLGAMTHHQIRADDAPVTLAAAVKNRLDQLGRIIGVNSFYTHGVYMRTSQIRLVDATSFRLVEHLANFVVQHSHPSKRWRERCDCLLTAPE
jgi:hypothetical protein